jgi:beta-lactam-binding protein with PASTA domain
MPNFAGQPLGTVTQTLQVAGMRVGNVTTAPVPEGTSPTAPYPGSIIVSQDPAAGEKVIAGATVNFEVR